MRAIWTLTTFLIRDLFRSLAGLVPVAGATTFYLIAFEYGMDQAQFITVAGVATGVLCLVTALLLAGRANRASFYPFLARLRGRGELLAAIVLGSLIVTAGLTLLMTEAALLRGQLSLDRRAVLWIVPTWAAVWGLGAALALVLTPLTSRGGSHMAGYVILTALLVLNDREPILERLRVPWLTRGVDAVLWPVSSLLASASSGAHGRAYLLALGLTLAYALLAYVLALLLLAGKDLLWAE